MDVPEPGVLITFSKRKYCYLGWWQHGGSALYIRIHDKLLSMAGKKEEEIRVICPLKMSEKYLHACLRRGQPWYYKLVLTEPSDGYISGQSVWRCKGMGHILGLVCECQTVDKRRLLCGLFLEETNGSTMIPNSHPRKMLMKRKKTKKKAKRRQKSLKL